MKNDCGGHGTIPPPKTNFEDTKDCIHTVFDVNDVRRIKTPREVSGVVLKNLPNLRSKQCLDLNKDVDFVIETIAAEQDVSEIDVYEHSPSRFRRSHSIKALRIVHRMYPTQTRLYLEDGLWHLEPVMACQEEQ